LPVAPKCILLGIFVEGFLQGAGKGKQRCPVTINKSKL